jgi:hypothetical protein
MGLTDTQAWLGGDGYLVRHCILPVGFEYTDQCFLVINGVISLPIAVLAYFFLPDTPGTAKPNWIFTESVCISQVCTDETKLIPRLGYPTRAS